MPLTRVKQVSWPTCWFGFCWVKNAYPWWCLVIKTTAQTFTEVKNLKNLLGPELALDGGVSKHTLGLLCFKWKRSSLFCTIIYWCLLLHLLSKTSAEDEIWARLVNYGALLGFFGVTKTTLAPHLKHRLLHPFKPTQRLCLNLKWQMLRYYQRTLRCNQIISSGQVMHLTLTKAPYCHSGLFEIIMPLMVFFAAKTLQIVQIHFWVVQVLRRIKALVHIRASRK